MIAKLLIMAFLIGHAVVHFLFLIPVPAIAPGAPPWPFDLSRSWALGALGLEAPVIRMIAIVLVAVLVIGSGAAVLSLWGLLPQDTFASGIQVGATASLALVALFFHPRLVLGVAIDAALLYLVTLGGWSPQRG